ncbi:hypothetical protein ATANTOWER_008311 [Ataeniobius toweri]|uniref:Uncharacterized protein n=1 Tax=Ataeniobius toweri TaxID=208326 RepID=A0ABU7C738_9TELE|nr:hypothetical protein [Ataeniobius toweri]
MKNRVNIEARRKLETKGHGGENRLDLIGSNESRGHFPGQQLELNVLSGEPNLLTNSVVGIRSPSVILPLSVLLPGAVKGSNPPSPSLLIESNKLLYRWSVAQADLKMQKPGSRGQMRVLSILHPR